jgi:hypothetical protein
LVVEVLYTERRQIKREHGIRVRDEGGNYVYEYGRCFPDKKHAHRYNHCIRSDAKNKTLFKVFGLHMSDLEVSNIKWS